jgi:hypothetical protein
MNDEILNGDWIHLTVNNKYFVGYIVDISESYFTQKIIYDLEITQINHEHVSDTQMRVYKDNNIKKFKYIRLHKEDVESLFDLALQTYDRQWFDILTTQYNSWILN